MTHLTDDEHRDAARAGQADQEYRALAEAFEQTRAGFLETIVKSGFEETGLREKCYFAVIGLDAVKNVLLTVASSKAVVEHTALIRDILSGKDRAEG